MSDQLLTCEKAIKFLKEAKSELSRFHIKALFLFGSVARNEARLDSDVDVLVEFTKPIDLFVLIELQYFLEALFHRKVDVIPSNSLHEAFKYNVLKEAVRAA
jgi:predicted nucleotidyltransferase